MTPAKLESALTTLAEAAERAEAAIRRVPADRWQEVIHTGDGAWSRHQLLCHLAANDIRQLVRVRIGVGIPNPGDFEEHEVELGDNWNGLRVKERAGHDVETLIAEMRANRGALIDLLRSLTPEQRERPIPYRGVPTPIHDAVPTLVGHFDMHLGELFAGL
jgi:hypothetical protein